MQALNGKVELLHSAGDFDWLGSGSYFWEGDQRRAMEWANAKRDRGEYEEPFVVGAVIDLGNCLDLLVRENLELVRTAYDDMADVYKAGGKALPQNKEAPKDPSPDLVLRYLDCAVINYLHISIKAGNHSSSIEPFDTVRGLFSEGAPIYKDGGFFDKTHSQIAVRNLECIKGVFLPLGLSA